MAEFYVLTQDDLKFLKETLEKLRPLLGRINRITSQDHTLDLQEQQAPEVYLARAPEGGIAGLDSNTTGTGTIGLGDDVPTSEVCEIYRLIHSDAGTVQIKPTGYTKKVYNPSTSDIDPYALFIILRDKAGNWWAQVGSGLGGGGGSGGPSDTYVDVITCAEVDTVYGSADPASYAPTIYPGSIGGSDIGSRQITLIKLKGAPVWDVSKRHL